MFRQTITLVAITSLAYGAVTKKERVVEQKPLSDESRGSPEYDHEAFLGKDEAQEFDELPPEESKRRLGIIVDRIDENGDGKVDKEELKRWIVHAQNRYVVEDAEKQFSNSKVDKDGHMTWETYKKDTYGHVLEEQDDKDETGFSYAKMMNRDHRRWKRADQNGDEVLSLEEFKSFLHPEEYKHMKDTVLEETLEDIDKNGDGVLSLEEYIGDMYSDEDEGGEPEWVKTEREQFALHRDTDGDGVLNKEEVRGWIFPDDYDHVDAEASHLIYESDDDKDEVLTKEEILEHYTTFVGSQITNWGDDLRRHDEF